MRIHNIKIPKNYLIYFRNISPKLSTYFLESVTLKGEKQKDFIEMT